MAALLASLAQLAEAGVLILPKQAPAQMEGEDGAASQAKLENELPQVNSEALKAIEAILRALKALHASSSSFVTPSARWGLGSGHGFVQSASATRTAMAGPSGSSADVDMLDRRRASFNNLRARYDTSRRGSPTLAGSAGPSTPTSSRAPTTGTRTPTASGEVDDAILRILIRSAVATLYTTQNLYLLLSCLFLSTIFDSRHEDAAYAHSSSSSAQTATKTSSSRRQSNAMSVDASARVTHAPKVTQSALSHMDATRMTSIAEIVCLLLSSTLATPSGPVSDDSGVADVYGTREADGHRQSTLLSSAPSESPMQEIAKRRRRILDFSAAKDSVFKVINVNSGDDGVGDSKRMGGKGKGRDIDADMQVDPMGGDDTAGSTRGRTTVPASVKWQQSSTDGKIADSSSPRATVLRSKSRKRGREEEGTVLERLILLVESGNGRAQEAALWALADMVRENSEASLKFFKCQTPSGCLPTTMLLQLRNERSAPVRLAAFCALAHIIKVHPFTHRTNFFVLSEIVSLLSSSEEASVQVQACFTLAHLIADDVELQNVACKDLDCMQKLSAILQNTALAGATKEAIDEARAKGTAGPDELTIRLREGALTALVALTYEQDSTRRMLVDMTAPAVLPMVVPSLGAAALGIRVAACRLVRSLSRSVSILRTSLVDAGAATRLIAILKDDSEPDIVKTEVIATICNLALKFSPMKQLLISSGGLKRLVDCATHEKYEGIRLNALWALKNVLYSSDTETKTTVAEALTFDFMAALIQDKSSAIQEQTLNIVRNLASSREADIDLTIKGFGEERLFDLLESVIWARGEDVVTEHAAYILVNIATGSEEHRRSIINRPNLLDALLYFLQHPRAHIRDAGIWCAINLTFRQPNAAGKKPATPTGELRSRFGILTQTLD